MGGERVKDLLLTGATGGLGELAAKALAARGWRVFALGTNRQKLDALGEVPGILPIRTDITKDEDVQAALQAVLQHTDALQAVVNFAGVSGFFSMVEGEPMPAFERMLQVNMLGMARINRAFIDLVERGKGRIINCSSSAGWTTVQPFNAAYAASKRAVEAYTDGLRRELMFVDIPVIKIQPGPFRTDMVDGLEEDFQMALDVTTRYRPMLTRLRPMMDVALKRAAPAEQLVPVVVQAVESPRPRRRYRKGTGLMLSLLELVPEFAVDSVYRLLFHVRGKKGGKP